jgi:hypothetical protein
MILLGGCDRDGLRSASTTRDSAGVGIIESSTASWGPNEGVAVGEVATLQIGAVQGEAAYQFSQIIAAWRMQDGRIVIVDGASAEIRVFDASGRFTTAMGGRGDGPGEFQALVKAVPYRGDSIAAWDARAGRLSVFDGSGTLGRIAEISLPPLQAVARGTGPYAHSVAALFRGAFADGTLVFSPPVLVRYDAGERWGWEESFLRYSPSGSSLNDLATIPGPEFVAPLQGSVRLNPFVRTVVSAIGALRLYLGPNEAYEIRGVSVGGELEQIIRLSELDLTVDAEVQQAYREEQRTAAVYRSVPAQELERALRDAEFPAKHPPYSQIVLDIRDQLWVRDYRLPGAEAGEAWRVFGTNGGFLGTVETPAAFTVHQIGQDFILGTWTDEVDVPFVRIYPLRRR